MNKVFLVLFTLAFIFSFDLKTLADEGHSHDQNIKQATEKFKDGSTNTQQEDSADHTNMDHESGSGHEDLDMKIWT
ncbi:hypothetical protein V7152_04030 [Neobacillus drentensis]|uniref:hypothetical protein n=1 Tax=Neobacillus drentensis TaxID=220684 RepID=UPI003000C4B7